MKNRCIFPTVSDHVLVYLLPQTFTVYSVRIISDNTHTALNKKKNSEVMRGQNERKKTQKYF